MALPCMVSSMKSEKNSVVIKEKTVDRVWAVWGVYADDGADGMPPTILSVHRTLMGAERWTETHNLGAWWIYTYSVAQ